MPRRRSSSSPGCGLRSSSSSRSRRRPRGARGAARHRARSPRLRLLTSLARWAPSRGSGYRRSSVVATGCCSAGTRSTARSTGSFPAAASTRARASSTRSIASSRKRSAWGGRSGRGARGDRRLDRTAEELRGEARGAHHLRGRSRRPVARSSDVAGRGRQGPQALRGHRAGGSRAPSTDPALPDALASGDPVVYLGPLWVP